MFPRRVIPDTPETGIHANKSVGVIARLSVSTGKQWHDNKALNAHIPLKSQHSLQDDKQSDRAQTALGF